MGVLKKLGWDNELTPDELATIQKIGGDPIRRRGRPTFPAASSASCSSTTSSPTATARRARMRLGSARSGAGASRADLLAARRSRGEISDLSGRQAVPAAEYRLLRPEGRGRQGHRQAVPAHPHLRPAGRIRRRRRRNPLQQMAGRTAAGHVHRDQSVRCRRARHQGRRLGLGDRRREQRQGQGEGAGHRTGRQGRRLDAVPFRRLVRRQGSAQQLSGRHRSVSCSAKAPTPSRLTATTRQPACKNRKPRFARSARHKEAGPWLE